MHSKAGRFAMTRMAKMAMMRKMGKHAYHWHAVRQHYGVSLIAEDEGDEDEEDQDPTTTGRYLRPREGAGVGGDVGISKFGSARSRLYRSKMLQAVGKQLERQKLLTRSTRFPILCTNRNPIF